MSTNVRVQVDPPSPTPSDHSMGSGGSPGSRPQAHSWCEVSLPCTADDQVLQAQQLAIIPFIPKPPKMVTC